MRHISGETSLKRILVIGGSVAIWVAAMVVLLILSLQSEEDETPRVTVSMGGRFVSDITMEYEGKTLHYRENEITNYLIIGVDKTDVTQVSGHQHGGQADFLLLLSIDRVSRTITPVMLDRDTMVEMQTYGVFGHPSGMKVLQLCLAQAYSGVNIPGSINTVETVERLLHGVQVDHYIVLDMTAIPLLNDAIGGVEVTLQDDFTSLDPAMTQGTTLRLMGEHAEFFVRGRMTIADGSNASRMARQQQYMAAFIQQFRQQIGSDQEKLTELLGIASGHMNSDASQERIISDVSAYEAYEWLPMVTFSGTHRVDEFGFAEFWVDEAELAKTVATLWFE